MLPVAPYGCLAGLHVGLGRDIVVYRVEDNRRHALGLVARDAGILDRIG
jgi:hypothetical protein